MLRLRFASMLATAVLATFACAGCRVFDESLLGEDAAVDAGTDAGPVDAGPAGDAGCVPKRPPARPSGSDEDGAEILFALRDLDLDQRGERWRSIGYDLDGLCSVPPEPALECALRDDSAVPPADGVDGTDNSFGARAPLLLLGFVADFESRFRAVQLEGRGLVLLRLRGWNGADDDPRVDVILSHGVRAEPGGVVDAGTGDGGAPDAGTGDGGAPTIWDGEGVFYGSSDDFVGGNPTRPKIRNDNAYVSGRTLVVPLPERVELSWEGEGVVFTVKLTDSVLTARISDDAASLEDAVLAGRWPVLDLLDGFEGLTFCPGSESQVRLERLLDEIADVSETAGEGIPEVPCDAVSVGIGLTGYRGVWGGLEAPTPPPNPCL